MRKPRRLNDADIRRVGKHPHEPHYQYDLRLARDAIAYSNNYTAMRSDESFSCRVGRTRYINPKTG